MSHDTKYLKNANWDQQFIVLLDKNGYYNTGKEAVTGLNINKLAKSYDYEGYPEYSGGIPFCDIDKIYELMGNSYYYRTVIFIPDDNIIEKKSYYNLAQSLLLGDLLLISDLSCWSDDKYCFKAVNFDGNNLKYVKNKTPTICYTAVKQTKRCYKEVPCDISNYVEIIKMVIDKDYYGHVYVELDGKFEDKVWIELCMLGLKRNGLCIQYIKNPTEEMYQQALESTPGSFRFYPNKTYELWLKYIAKDGKLLFYVPDEFLTYELCLMAINNNPEAEKYLEENDNHKKIHHFDTLGKKQICDVTCQHFEKLRLIAIDGSPSTFIEMKEPSYNVRLKAVQQCSLNIGFIDAKDQNEELCLEAVKAIKATKYIDRYFIGSPYWRLGYVTVTDLCHIKTDEVCIESIKQDDNGLKYIKNKTTKLCMMALNINSENIQHIEENLQTEEMISIVAKKGGSSLYFYVNKQLYTKELLLIGIESTKPNNFTFILDLINRLVDIKGSPLSNPESAKSICATLIKKMPNCIHNLHEKLKHYC